MANRVRRSNRWRKQQFQDTARVRPVYILRDPPPPEPIELDLDPIDYEESAVPPKRKKPAYRNKPPKNKKNPFIPRMSIKNYTPPPMRGR